MGFAVCVSSNFIPGSLTKLSEKQKVFGLFFISIVRGNIAAIKAGYAPKHAHKTAYRLLQNNNLRVFMADAIEDLIKKHGIDLDWRYRTLKEIVDDCKTNDPGTALKGIDIVNKMTKIYAEDRGLEDEIPPLDGARLNKNQKEF